MSPISIKSIAREAGVSHSTVSRALRDSPLVNQRTKERIQWLARELDYFPNSIARSLVTRQTQTVGVVVTTIADPFVAEVVQGIENRAHERGYSVILASSNSEPQREISAVEMLRGKRVDAVIVTSSRVGALYLDILGTIGVPIVLINSHSEESGRYTFSVGVDNRHGGYLATKHLIKLGHRRIAYVSGAPDHSDNLDRLAGYRQALDEAAILLDPALVIEGTGRADGGERALPMLIAVEEPPSASFCYNDMTAIGLLCAARQAGLSVPGDLAIVGFDDIPFASYVYPALTTVAQPKVEMGEKAMEMALALRTSEGVEDAGVPNLVLQGQLVIRGSSGGVREGD